MMKKMCPVCDSQLTAGGICPVCRKWVRNPVYMEVNYYLNERHPEGEKSCDYHNPGPKYDTYHHSHQSKEKPGEKRKTASQGMKTRKKAGKRQIGRGKVWIIIIIAYFLINIIGGLFGMLGSILDGMMF